MNILVVGPVPPLRGGISDFNNELISTINKKHNISIYHFQSFTQDFFFLEKINFTTNQLISKK